MPLRRHVIIAVFLLSLFALPRPGSGQWLDFIWSMSGPGMIGAFGGCKVPLSNASECRDKYFGPFRFGKDVFDGPPLWLAVQGAYFRSVRNTPPETQVEMIAAETIIEVRSIANDHHLFYHGFIGYAYNHFVGDQFRRVPRSALRFRPAAYRYKTQGDYVIALAYNLRFYPNGVEQEDFISGLQGGNRDSEWVHSFSLDVSLPSF